MCRISFFFLLSPRCSFFSEEWRLHICFALSTYSGTMNQTSYLKMRSFHHKRAAYSTVENFIFITLSLLLRPLSLLVVTHHACTPWKLNHPTAISYHALFLSFFSSFLLLLARPLPSPALNVHSRSKCPHNPSPSRARSKLSTLTIPRIHRSSTPYPNKPPHTHPPTPPQPSNTLPLPTCWRLFMRKRPQLGSSIFQPLTFCTHNTPKRADHTSVRTNIHNRSQCRTRRCIFDTALSPMRATSWWRRC